MGRMPILSCGRKIRAIRDQIIVEIDRSVRRGFLFMRFEPDIFYTLGNRFPAVTLISPNHGNNLINDGFGSTSNGIENYVSRKEVALELRDITFQGAFPATVAVNVIVARRVVEECASMAGGLQAVALQMDCQLCVSKEMGGIR